MTDERHDQPVMFPEVDETLLRQLSPLLRAVVRALGFTRAREFLTDHGGILMRVPKNHSDTLGLTEGELQRLQITLEPHLDSARRVCFPKSDKLFIRARNAQIRIEKRSTSITALARRNKLTTRHIQNICKDEEPTPQLDLFEAGE